ncbi:hypothetical protein [Chryseobacterium sp. CCNWLW24]|jgi:hypothetical protein
MEESGWKLLLVCGLAERRGDGSLKMEELFIYPLAGGDVNFFFIIF